MNTFLKFFALVLFSYLMGNISFARFLAKRRQGDITSHGSGNPGTMNMLRTYGVTLAVITLLFDAVKCVIPCLIAKFLLFPCSIVMADIAVYTAGISCVVGHMYPVLYKFKGGKGVASGFGMTIVAQPIVSLCCFAGFFITFVLLRIGSVSTIMWAVIFSITASVMLLIKGYYISFILLVLTLALIIFAHRSNIKRWLNRNEKKIDLKEAVQKDIDYANKKKQERLQKNNKNIKNSQNNQEPNNEDKK